MEIARAPVMAWCVRHGKVIKSEFVPYRHFMNAMKAEFFDELTAASRHYDALVRFEDFEALFVQVVEVCMGYHHQIYQRH